MNCVSPACKSYATFKYPARDLARIKLLDNLIFLGLANFEYRGHIAALTVTAFWLVGPSVANFEEHAAYGGRPCLLTLSDF